MIRLEIPWLPPSTNHAYRNSPWGGRQLSSEGRSFLIRTKVHLVQSYRKELRLFEPNEPFAVAFRFYFETIENKGWAAKKAKNRYKTFDGDNRCKLLADALKDAGGIDDSQTLMSAWEKTAGTPERTTIWAWNLKEERGPLGDVFLHFT